MQLQWQGGSIGVEVIAIHGATGESPPFTADNGPEESVNIATNEGFGRMTSIAVNFSVSTNGITA